MVTSQYASFRTKIPVTAFTVEAVAGANTTIAYDYNFYLQFQNRAGVNLLSDRVSVNIPVSSKARITINQKNSGEEVFWYVISAENTGNEQDAKVLCRLEAKESQVTDRALPLTIELSEDEHFALGGVVADKNSLPSNPANGNMRFIANEGKYYIYGSQAVNGKILGIQYNNIGNWLETKQVFSSYLEDTTSNGVVKGCDRPLHDSDDGFPVPPKTAFNSIPLKIWLQHGFSVDGLSPLVAGTKFTLQVKIDGVDRTVNFADKILLIVRGKVNKIDGILDTDFLGGGEQVIWNPDSFFSLGQDLERGSAIALDVVLAFDNTQLLNLIPSNAQITLDLYQISELQGRTSELSSIVSDLVLSNRDKLLIVPNRRLSGVATIEPNYLIDSTIEQQFTDLLPDTNGQIIAISGSANGFTKVYQNSSELENHERIRAIVSTENGIGILSNPQTIAIAQNEKLIVTVTHPVDPTTLLGTIRSDYPDSLIRGNEKADFSINFGYIFLDINSAKYQSSQLSVNPATSQTFEFGNLNSFTSITNFPSATNDFGLFQIEELTLATNTGGNFSTTSITVYWAYDYPIPNAQITKIDHLDSSCIPTATYSLADALTLAALKSENLADLQNTEQARLNLNAASIPDLNTTNSNLSSHIFNNSNPHSTTAGETGALGILNNLGDLNNLATARDNLGLGTAATRSVGNSISSLIEVIDVDGTPSLPVLDGSQLTGISGRLKTEFVSGSFNAIADTLYLIDTLTESATATLPANPTDKTAIAFSDRIRTFGTNNATINPGTGDTINGASNFLLDVNGEAITLIYDQINNDWVQVDGIQGTVTSTEVGTVTVENDFDAVINGKYRVKTNVTTVTATLPVTPIDSGEISFLDSSGSDPRVPTGFGLNPLIIAGNGATIQGYNENLIVDVENTSIALKYNAIASDWELKSH